MPNYSGVWTLQEQYEAILAGNWTGIPLPELYAWGRNNEGQLGQEDTVNRSSPVQVGTDTTWSDISAGTEHVLARKENGTLWAFGNGGNGRLGLNNTTAFSSPVQIGSETNWTSSFSACSAHSFAVTTEGELYAWGDGGDGRLAQNSTTSFFSPVQIGALTNWANVVESALNQNGFAIKTDGTLWAWGQGADGVLGINTTDNQSSPVQVGALTNWSRVASGQNWCLALKTDGTLWSWGTNENGRLGLNLAFNVKKSSPVQIGSLTNWVDIGCGREFGAAIDSSGELYVWGLNSAGQLGLNDEITRSSPVQVGALTNWSKITNNNSACASLKTDGTLWGWGQNFHGNIGDGATVYRSSPVQVGSLATWSDIDGGSSFCVGINQARTGMS